MLDTLNARVLIPLLNHLLDAAPSARHKLAQHAGKRVTIQLSLISVNIALDNDGRLLSVDDSNSDAQFHLNPLILAHIALGDKTATHRINITGDTQLAADIGNTLMDLDWDAEADLAHFLGDATAHQIIKIARNLIKWKRSNVASSALMLVEYAHEESGMIIKRKPLQQFISDVDSVRDDTARLAKRIELLTSQLKSNQ
jgi:ubiquinone biosynthesis protein UbiJ